MATEAAATFLQYPGMSLTPSCGDQGCRKAGSQLEVALAFRISEPKPRRSARQSSEAGGNARAFPVPRGGADRNTGVSASAYRGRCCQREPVKPESRPAY
ncbi:unnamed protein product [Rangifer tarandus platyrhynchus]|uniref:Uncharacterized protein n=1 Tax=Rangifer tarandus platyrhynchus TaxID=3082113 RepID=A0ABN8Y6S6_RANTA|nr:unnamed protein product [Rangifer tarandus platyrhynchus]